MSRVHKQLSCPCVCMCSWKVLREKWAGRSQVLRHSRCQIHKWTSLACQKLLGYQCGGGCRWHMRPGECVLGAQRPSCVMVPLLLNLNVSEKKKLHFPIVSILQSKLGNKLTFMLCPHLIPYLCRAEIVCWVSESKQPFQIVKDCGFQNLMKTGRPEYHILSAETVSCDARNIFVNVHKRIVKMLQVSNARHLIFF